MNKLVLMMALVVACLAGLALGQASASNEKIVEADFRRLGLFLVDKLKDNTDSQANLDFLEEHVQELSDAERKAFEIIKQVRETKACSDEAIRLLASAVNSGATKMFGKGRGEAEERIDGLMRNELVEMAKLCLVYMDEQVMPRASSADPKLKEFIYIARPHWTLWVHYFDMKEDEESYMYLLNDNYTIKSTQEINKDLLCHDLYRNADANDGHEFKLEPKDSLDNKKKIFEAGFKEYLVEPCRKFSAHFDPLFDGFKAIAAFVENYRYVSNRTVLFRQLAYINKTCKAVQVLDENNDSEGKIGFNKDDILAHMMKIYPRTTKYGR